jgi:hypothetical protein
MGHVHVVSMHGSEPGPRFTLHQHHAALVLVGTFQIMPRWGNISAAQRNLRFDTGLERLRTRQEFRP